MNEYIKNKANELIDEHIKRGLWNTEELLSKISSQLYEIKSERDKIDMITLILEANELRNIKQQSGNFNNDNGATKVKYLEINYFLHQELEEIGVRPSDNFTSEEKERWNDKLDEILQTIINANEIVSEQVEELKAEIEELKHLYVLGKKNWKQQLGGKLTGLMMSGVITEASAKPIIEKVLKPSADFIVGRLMG